MTITEIYDTFTAGSQGFCAAVWTHCGYDISHVECERIAKRAKNADDFHTIWRDEDWWTDRNTWRA